MYPMLPLREERLEYQADFQDSQEFRKIRDKCLQKKELFCDPDFDAKSSSINYNSRVHRKIEWKRPRDIVKDPRFFVEGASRFDIKQGELGDCWLLAAVANLTLNEKLFYHVVPTNQEFDDKYAGIFHFRFWRYSKWVDIVIDDRLPTKDGKLKFLSSADKNEFWSALLEKAYAKLHGSYDSLEGGLISEAMVDFTGGISEWIEIIPARTDTNRYEELSTIMFEAFDRQSLMGCSIPDNGKKRSDGLVMGHAYSITRLVHLRINTSNKTNTILLIRLRNPWGNANEWNGPWSDKSTEWNSVPKSYLDELQLKNDEDGEFWMSYRDFINNFVYLDICHLNLDLVSNDQVEDGSSKKWKTSIFEGKWVPGITAGGSRKNIETFANNPQFLIELENPDRNDNNRKCSVIVDLMQKYRRSKRIKKNINELNIGFAVYQVGNPKCLPKPLGVDFFQTTNPIGESKGFQNFREVNNRYSLLPGTYCIIPSSLNLNEEGEFLLRVFSEYENTMTEHDDVLGIVEATDLKKTLMTAAVGSKSDNYDTLDNKISKLFFKQADKKLRINSMQLKYILDYGFLKDIKFDGFSKDVCRSLISMLDCDKLGTLNFEIFEKLWNYISRSKEAFKLFDLQNKGYIIGFNLRDALYFIGYRLNINILNIMCRRYSSNSGKIKFHDFIMCAVRLQSMIDMFNKQDPNKTNVVSFTMEEWIEKTICL